MRKMSEQTCFLCKQTLIHRSSACENVTMDYETATVATEAEMTNMEISESDNQFYDAIIPSWHGEFCDNIPNYLFCQFQRRPKATMNKTENTVPPPGKYYVIIMF